MILTYGGRLVRVRAKANNVRTFRDDPLIIMRHMAADRWFSKYRREMFKILKAQVLEASARVAAGSTEPVTDSMETRWTRELVEAKRKPVMAMVRSGIALTENMEFGKKSIGNLFAGKADFVGLETVGYDEDDIFLHQARVQSVENYLQETSKMETATSRKNLDKLYKDANSYWDPVLQRGLTPREVAKQMTAQGLADSTSRATLMSRTTTMWAYNEGSHQSYISAGVQAETWVVSQDDVLCEFCVQMDGQTVRTEEPFVPKGSELTGVEGGVLSIPTEWPISHPPLHPMCRCALVPVILPGQAVDALREGDRLRSEYMKSVEDGTLKESRSRRSKLLRRRRKKRPERKPAPRKTPTVTDSPFNQTKETRKTLVKKKPSAPKKKIVKKEPEVVEFTPAKTKKEGTQWAEDNIINPKSPAFNRGLEPVVGYEKLPMESVNVINKELAELTKQYGIKLNGIEARALGHAEADVFAGMTRTRMLDLNTKYWKRLDAFGKHVSRLSADGWHASLTVQDILAHEYGHGIIGLDSAKRKLINEAFKAHGKHLVKAVSRYGATTAEEMWAEIFVKFHRGRKLPKWADDLSRKVLGKPARKVRKVTKAVREKAIDEKVLEDALDRIIIAPRAERAGDVLKEVSVKPFDKGFKKNTEDYISSSGKGEITGRRERFRKFLDTGEDIIAPEVSITDEGVVNFINGRHRYSVLRDMGADAIKVSMDSTSVLNSDKLKITKKLIKKKKAKSLFHNSINSLRRMMSNLYGGVK